MFDKNMNSKRNIVGMNPRSARRRTALVGSFAPISGFAAAGVFFTLSLLLFSASPSRAYERYITTAGLIRQSPYVAHARVESSRKPSSRSRVREYNLILLENLKGELPASFRVRILEGSRVADPDGLPDPPGQEWIVILGKKNRRGLYPLRSLNWGKIELYARGDSGEMYLARRVTGMGREYAARFMPLRVFKEMVRQILGR